MPNSIRSRRKARIKVIEIQHPDSSANPVTTGAPGVYLSPTTVEFYPFDEEYLKRLQVADPETTAHFFAYFTRLLRIKLRTRKLAHHIIEDIMQDTFMHALEKVKDREIRQPTRLGAYVNGICNNLIFEHYRRAARNQPIDGSDFDVPDATINLEHVVELQEIKERIRTVLAKMPQRDRDILKEIYFDERNKDEICREHGVGRVYLRVLLHRALKLFKDLYGKK